MSNPGLVRQVMDSPMVQQMMSNPDIMRHMFTSNPQMRDLMEVSCCMNVVCVMDDQFLIVTRTWKITVMIL